MTHRYPSEVELKAIANWTGTIRELIEFVQSIWEYDPPELKNGRDFQRKKCYRLFIHSWGWSGNESIIGELMDTWMWFIFWKESRRGGHYELEIPVWAMDNNKSGNHWGSQFRRVKRKNVSTKKQLR